MKIYLIIGIIIICPLILLPIFFKIKRNYAKKKVKARKDYEKIHDLNKMLDPYGFLFEPVQEIFYSKIDAWQRKHGYCKLYDELAPSFNMVMDCEPVTFQYDKREWLIEFWKGQYGMLTGAEIGVYVANKGSSDSNPITGTVYEAVSDEERLAMSFRLIKERKTVVVRRGYHWWLTGFRVAEFSKPKQLSMDWEILFPNISMRDAFIGGLYKIGYNRYELWIDGTSVGGTFSRPKTKQPRRRHRCQVWLVQKMNRHNCKVFIRKTHMFERMIDKLDYVRLCFPLLYRLVLAFGKMRKLPKMQKKVSRMNRPGGRRRDRV